MPSTCCSVPKCNTRGGHIFPRDPVRKEKWIQAVRPLDKNTMEMWTPTKSSVVCQKHFSPDDYEKETYNGTERINKTLKKTAVPRVVDCPETKLKVHVPRSQYFARKSLMHRMFLIKTSANNDHKAEMALKQNTEINNLNSRPGVKEIETEQIKRCSWGTCRNISIVKESEMFLPFPSILNDYQKCVRWIGLCGGPNSRLNVDNITKLYGKEQFYVCFLHFKGDTLTSLKPDPEQAPTFVQPALKGNALIEETRIDLEETGIQKRCSWGTCQNRTKKKWVPKTDMFLPFPSILNDYQKCVRWIGLCRGPNSRLNEDIITKLYGKEQFYVCSKHFKGNTPTSINPDPEQAPAYVQPPLKQILKPPLKRKAPDAETRTSQFQNESKKPQKFLSILPKVLNSNETDNLFRFLKNVSKMQSNKESRPPLCESLGPVKGISKKQTEQRLPHDNIKVISRGLLKSGSRKYHKDRSNCYKEHNYCRNKSNKKHGKTLLVEVQVGLADDSSNEKCKDETNNMFVIDQTRGGSTKQSDHLKKSKKEQINCSDQQNKKNGVQLDINDEQAGPKNSGEISSWDSIVELVKSELMETKTSEGDDKLEVDLNLVKQEPEIYLDIDTPPVNSDIEEHDSHIGKTDLDKSSEIDKQHERAIDNSEVDLSLVKNEVVWDYMDEFGVCTSVRIDGNFNQQQGTCTHENVEGRPLKNQDHQTVSTDFTNATNGMVGVPECFIKTESELSDNLQGYRTVLQEYYNVPECSSGSTNQISDHEDICDAFCKGNTAPHKKKRMAEESLNPQLLTERGYKEEVLDAAYGIPYSEEVDSSHPLKETHPFLQAWHTAASTLNVKQDHNPQQNTNTLDQNDLKVNSGKQFVLVKQNANAVDENDLKVNTGRHFVLFNPNENSVDENDLKVNPKKYVLSIKDRHSDSTSKSENPQKNSLSITYPLSSEYSAISPQENRSSTNQLTNNHSNLSTNKEVNANMSPECSFTSGSSDPSNNITTCKGPIAESYAKGILKIDHLKPKERTTCSNQDLLDNYRHNNGQHTSIQGVKANTLPAAISKGQGHTLQQNSLPINENDFKVKAGRYILMITDEPADSTTKNDRNITPNRNQSFTDRFPIHDISHSTNKGTKTKGLLSEFCVKGVLKIDPQVRADILAKEERCSKKIINSKINARIWDDKNRVNSDVTLKQEGFSVPQLPVDTVYPSELLVSSLKQRNVLNDWDVVDREITANSPGQTAKHKDVIFLVKKGGCSISS